MMPPDQKRMETLLALREEIFAEMEQAETEFSAVRLRVERMESDLRIGKTEPPQFAQVKGHALPQAEARVVDLFRGLLKLEDKINAARRGLD